VTSDVALRPATDADIVVLSRIQDAQDTAWWGSPEGDEDDMRAELNRARLAGGTLDDNSRVAVVRGPGDERVVGFALVLEQGLATLAVDPAIEQADDASRRLVEWIVATKASVIATPARDRSRLALLAEFGWRPRRSSFELHRDAAIGDLGEPSWPSRIAPVPFRLGIDDVEVHELIYSVWTDVAGHTDRPFEQWQALLIHEESFVPELAVVARRDAGRGPVAGVAMCRRYTGGVGWVSQLAVGRPDRGVGLGRSLLIESFRRLVLAGAVTLALDVEAVNVNALGLYRSVGLAVSREWLYCSPD
jgi:ribosomal protein S18 acetylase RimI-like enzyme